MMGRGIGRAGEGGTKVSDGEALAKGRYVGGGFDCHLVGICFDLMTAGVHLRKLLASSCLGQGLFEDLGD